MSAGLPADRTRGVCFESLQGTHKKGTGAEKRATRGKIFDSVAMIKKEAGSDDEDSKPSVSVFLTKTFNVSECFSA